MLITAVALGAVVRKHVSGGEQGLGQDFGASPSVEAEWVPVSDPYTFWEHQNKRAPAPDGVEYVGLASDAEKDMVDASVVKAVLANATLGDISVQDVADIVKLVGKDKKEMKKIMKDVFGKGVVAAAKAALHKKVHSRSDFCWQRFQHRTRVANTTGHTAGALEADKNMFAHKKLDCPEGSELVHGACRSLCGSGMKPLTLDKAFCHTECQDPFPTHCGLGCADSGLDCASAILADAEATLKAGLAILAVALPATAPIDASIAETLDVLHAVGSTVHHALKPKNTLYAEKCFMATLLALHRHEGVGLEGKDTKKAATQGLKQTIGLAMFAKKATHVVSFVYSSVKHHWKASDLLKTGASGVWKAMGTTMLAGLGAVKGMLSAFVAPVCELRADPIPRL